MTSRENSAWWAALVRCIPRKWWLLRATRSAVSSTGELRQTKASTSEGFASESFASESDKCVYFWVKRLLDVFASLILLLSLMPFLAVVALAIKLDSPGPVFFSQQRMGYDWRKRRQQPFICYKFRSMVHGCDESLHRTHVQQIIRARIAASDPDSAARLVKLTDDSRITRVGHILRKTSIDELPQLWNILRGEMSLVGPRPVPLYEVAEYAPQHLGRLQAIPGLTGLWQVKGRGSTTIDEMVAMDLDYIRHQSLGLDFKILLLTIPVALSMHGAE